MRLFEESCQNNYEVCFFVGRGQSCGGLIVNGLFY